MTDETYYATEADTQADDNGFTIQLDDDTKSRIEASDVSAAGLTLALGRIDPNGGGWGEVDIDWAATQTLADELNAKLRQARINGWI